MTGACSVEGDNAECTGLMSSEGQSATAVETMENWQTLTVPVIVTAGVEKLSGGGDSPTKTSDDQPSETSADGSEDGSEGEDADEDGSGDNDESGAVQLVCGSLLGAAAVAVGVALI